MRFGTASATVFLIDLYETTGQQTYLDEAERLTDALLAAATQDDAGTRWRLPRYGFQGDEGTLTAFTGYHYGAVGFGWLLLRLHAAQHDATQSTRLPDNPFVNDHADPGG